MLTLTTRWPTGGGLETSRDGFHLVDGRTTTTLVLFVGLAGSTGAFGGGGRSQTFREQERR